MRVIHCWSGKHSVLLLFDVQLFQQNKVHVFFSQSHLYCTLSDLYTLYFILNLVSDRITDKSDGSVKGFLTSRVNSTFRFFDFTFTTSTFVFMVNWHGTWLVKESLNFSTLNSLKTQGHSFILLFTLTFLFTLILVSLTLLEALLPNSRKYWFRSGNMQEGLDSK